MMKQCIDLNCDLGESFGIYTLGQDEEILKLVTSANIACGYHAGDHRVMAETVDLAKASGTAVGAHPGYPDLAGFGRRAMNIDPEEIYDLVIYQIGALQGFCQSKKVSMQHVKPHGALYNHACADQEAAEAVAEAVAAVNPGLLLYGLSGSELIKAGEKKGLKTVNEVFADRTYMTDGSLTPRSHAKALIHDKQEAEHRVIEMISSQQTEALDGSLVPLQADTICVHGDKPEALDFVKQLHEAFSRNNITAKAPGEFSNE
ncbi:LamB/YcsF family protein [Alteribacillus sp. HJP-4]|uniref:LamB/YcsF family protein n=1 Tax=Alteribacillus sp. HJP-4 TaxID=2775394 RepID=UPI0035CCCFD9